MLSNINVQSSMTMTCLNALKMREGIVEGDNVVAGLAASPSSIKKPIFVFCLLFFVFFLGKLTLK